jgi:hypothetical protein
MKKIFGITGIILSLVTSSAYASFRLGNKPRPETRRSTSDNNQRDYSARPAQNATVAEVKCDKGNSVTYDFVSAISGGEISYEKVDGQLIVTIPEYFKACIDDINITSKIGPHNNIYVKFEIEPSEEMRNAPGKELEHRYESCIKQNYPNIKDWKDADKAGLIERNKFRKAISLGPVDTSKDSEVIIASPDKVYGYDQNVFGTAFSGLPSSSDSQWNCMRFEDPSSKPVMANKTKSYDIRQEAINLCRDPKNASLADIEAQLEKMKNPETSGNLMYLVNILENMKDELLKEEEKKSLERLAEIEEELVPDDDDLEAGEKFGVSKKKAKELAKEYAEIMEKFHESYGPAISDQIKDLLIERSAADDARVKAIDKEIEKLNNRALAFARHSGDNKEQHELVIKALKETNLKSSARDVFSGAALAEALGRVYVTDEDDRGKRLTLGKVNDYVKKANKQLSADIFRRWDDERDLAKGKRTPITRRQQMVRELQKRGQQDYRKFQSNLGQYDKYMNNYVQQMIKSYCTSGGSQQNCQYVQQQYAPYIMNQYNQYKQRKNQSYGQYWSSKYGSNISKQQSLVRRYEGMYQQAQFNIMQDRMNRDLNNGFGSSSSDSIFDIWAGPSDISGGFDFGGQFDMGGLPPMPGQQQAVPYDMRAPASGNATFGNPYFRGTR